MTDENSRPANENETEAYRRDLENILNSLPGFGSPAPAEPEKPAEEDGEDRLHARAPVEDQPEMAGTEREKKKEQRRQQRREQKQRRKARHNARRHRALVQSHEESRHPAIKTFLHVLVTLTLVGVMLAIGISNYIESDLLKVPQDAVAAVMTPVQSAFSGVTEGIAGFFRRLRLLQNIEEEYNKLREEYEQIVYDAYRTRELENQLAQFRDMHDEILENPNMLQKVCRVIGREEGNYFSTFTIDRGSADGVKEYMAVTSGGALVGYTETVYEHSAIVRTIIDSEASIAAMLQSSRDQGTVRGTLGIDGTAMCRMYYLPDDHLPRPGDTVFTSGVGMSFPYKIPIGTVRESTRGMQQNKSYIVVEPLADFQHLEFVMVLCYQPAPQPVQGRSSLLDTDQFEPLETIRPVPTLRMGSLNYFDVTATPEDMAELEETPAPTETAVETTAPAQATPSGTVGPLVSPGPQETPIEYVSVYGEPTATPTPEPTPSPTPYITLTPELMTVEED